MIASYVAMVFVIGVLLSQIRKYIKLAVYIKACMPIRLHLCYLSYFSNYCLSQQEWTIIRLPYHVHMEEWYNAQHIYCSLHPVQFPWDTDNLVHTLVHKELDIGSCMLQDMLFHILYTLDPRWDTLSLLIYQYSFGNSLNCLTIWWRSWYFCS